jgi:hypothetical protein
MHYELFLLSLQNIWHNNISNNKTNFYDKRGHLNLFKIAEQRKNLEQERKNSNEKIVDHLEAIDSEITKILVEKYYI